MMLVEAVDATLTVFHLAVDVSHGNCYYVHGFTCDVEGLQLRPYTTTKSELWRPNI